MCFGFFVRPGSRALLCCNRLVHYCQCVWSRWWLNSLFWCNRHIKACPYPLSSCSSCNSCILGFAAWCQFYSRALSKIWSRMWNISALASLQTSLALSKRSQRVSYTARRVSLMALGWFSKFLFLSWGGIMLTTKVMIKGHFYQLSQSPFLFIWSPGTMDKGLNWNEILNELKLNFEWIVIKTIIARIFISIQVYCYIMLRFCS